MSRLEIEINNQLNLEISNQTGLLKSISSNKQIKINSINSIDKINLIIKKQNELKEYFEDSTVKTHYQLRRIALQLRTDIIDLKQQFLFS